MHTKLILEAKRMFKPDELKHFTDALQSIADASDFVLSVEELHPKRYVKIVRDTWDRGHIRKEFDYCGKLFIVPNRYFSGDEDAEDPQVTYAYVDLGGYKLYLEGYDDVSDPPESALYRDDIVELLYEHYNATEAGSSDEQRCKDTIDWLEDLPVETETVLRDDIAICLPVYAYAHGGVTVSHGSFSCPWDSGCAGAHYTTKDTVKKEFNGDLEAAEHCLRAELKDFDHWLQGNIWGYQVIDENGDEIDSYYGFIGDDLDETGIADHFGDEFKDALKEAWDARFD